jgi:hypothetical protein
VVTLGPTAEATLVYIKWPVLGSHSNTLCRFFVST